MSDYVRKKVIRIPFPKEILEKCNTTDPYECEKYLKENIEDNLFSCLSYEDVKGFEIECTYESNYIDWVYYSTYGEESGDFGHVSMLSDKEYETIKPIFNKLPFDVKREEMRKVDYCYYNCCECTDYYEIKDIAAEDLI